MNGLLVYTERPYAKILLKNNTTLYVKVGSLCEIRKNRMQYFAKMSKSFISLYWLKDSIRNVDTDQ